MGKNLKKDADYILNQLEPHSFLWSRLLRKYIRYLERRLKAKGEKL